jgi:hypothetical protein
MLLTMPQIFRSVKCIITKILLQERFADRARIEPRLGRPGGIESSASLFKCNQPRGRDPSDQGGGGLERLADFLYARRRQAAEQVWMHPWVV